MNSPIRINDAERVSAIVASYPQVSRQSDEIDACCNVTVTDQERDAMKLHILTRIKAARDDGFTGLAEALVGFYHQLYTDEQ